MEVVCCGEYALLQMCDDIKLENRDIAPNIHFSSVMYPRKECLTEMLDKFSASIFHKNLHIYDIFKTLFSNFKKSEKLPSIP